MRFEFPAQPQRQGQPRGGGCGRLIFMMALMFAAYYMFSAGRPRQENLKQEIFGDGTVGSTVDRQPAGREMPSTGRSGAQQGWQMDEFEPASKSDNDFRSDNRLPAPSNSQPRTKSDWSMEDAGDLKGEAVPADRQRAPLKKAEGGWKLEEVD